MSDEACGKELKLAVDTQVYRGLCNKKRGHCSLCANDTCYRCGSLNVEFLPTGRKRKMCLRCDKIRRRKGFKRSKWKKVVGNFYTFGCGCSGILPYLREGNKFACWHNGSGSFTCRVHSIILGIRGGARRGNYKALDSNISHEKIREMMEIPECILCNGSLNWETGRGITPHLHHDHLTGEPLGFAHPVCHVAVMQKEIFRLKKENEELRAECLRLQLQGIPP